MPWLGDGTWVEDARLARDIVHGRTNYRPWSHDLSTATPNAKAKRRSGIEPLRFPEEGLRARKEDDDD